jgi:hypothetical protein
MDTLLQLTTVLAAFAAVHERLIEFLQQLSRSPVGALVTLGGRLSWEGGPAIAWKSSALGIGLAVASQASLLDLFLTVPQPGGPTSLFFLHYLQYEQVPGVPPFRLDLRNLGGCLLMGLSTGLGSKFWHDLTSGLTDLRDRARAVTAAAAPLATPPSTPPASTGTVLPATR